MMSNKKILLTPGPLTTSASVKETMLQDYGSRDPEFIGIVNNIRKELVKIAGGGEDYTALLLPGSGTYIMEACFNTLIGKNGHLLILINGAYGRRSRTICDYIGIPYTVLEKPENEVIPATEVLQILSTRTEITHVALTYCETTTGIANPVGEIADVVNQKGRHLILDAMSAFGALPLNCEELSPAAVMASSNKCLHGVPGISFAVMRKSILERTKGNSRSLSFDLYQQWTALEATGQFRFTPPVQVLAAFSRAIQEHTAEGGVAGRYARCRENYHTVLSGMENIGFQPYLRAEIRSPIIITFRNPRDKNYNFDVFYQKLNAQGFVIYPGKLTQEETFRIGCIGNIDRTDMARFITAAGAVVKEMNITQF